MNRTLKCLTLAGLLIGTCATLPAYAYVGPGAGVTLIGALIGLLSAIGLALWAGLRWPIRRLLARQRAARAGDGDASSAPT
jgi:hypothetical protein